MVACYYNGCILIKFLLLYPLHKAINLFRSAGKNVRILAASVTTGFTVRGAIEAINYYGGVVAGISAIFATVENFADIPVRAVFDPNDLDGYASYSSHECPYCKKGEKIDALVNSFGYSKLL